MAHGNSKEAMLRKIIDLYKMLETEKDQESVMATYYKMEILRLTKRVYNA